MESIIRQKTNFINSFYLIAILLTFIAQWQLIAANPVSSTLEDVLLDNHNVKIRQINADYQPNLNFVNFDFGDNDSRFEASDIDVGAEVSVQAQPTADTLLRLSQNINNLVEAAARPEIPAPQQVIRTAMNSGL